MIKELVELGEKIRNEESKKSIVHDALIEEQIALVLTISKSGKFISLSPLDKRKTSAEAIQRTRGAKARFLLDTCEYTFGVFNPDSQQFKTESKTNGEKKAKAKFTQDAHEKHELYLEKIEKFKNIDELEPIINFFKGKENGIGKMTQKNFETIPNMDRNGNVAILVEDSNKYLNEYKTVYSAIIKNYEKDKKNNLKDNSEAIKCSVCGKSDSPIGDYPHRGIKNVPGDKEPAGGRKLISYNGEHNPYESYGMVGNENSGICTKCSIGYVEGLKWLLSNGPKKINEKSKKTYTDYSNRKNLGNNSALVFWTKSNNPIELAFLLDKPVINNVLNFIELYGKQQKRENRSEDVKHILNSPASGNKKVLKNIETDRFYAFSLTGVSARIAVRGWIESDLEIIKDNISSWFKEIEIDIYGNEKIEIWFAPIFMLAECCGTHRKEEKNGKTFYKLDRDDSFIAKAAQILWDMALLKNKAPQALLDRVLRRIKVESGRLTNARMALIKLILNRQLKGGEQMIKEKLDESNGSVAYVCGRIFSVMENIQRCALGKDLNAGIRERFFSSASLTPSTAFGRLARLNQQHLSKLKGEKPGLYVVLDKELGQLYGKIKSYPQIFTLEEQGQFAIGYYHQKMDTFARISEKPELKDVVETVED